MGWRSLERELRARRPAVVAMGEEAVSCAECLRLARLAKSLGAKKIGIATCGGLIAESKTLTKILEVRGFDVVSVSCKCGSVPKKAIGVPKEDLGSSGKFEAICNPVAQAKLLNHARTDLNILLGLCVGHDALFLQQSAAPTTVLVAKDRVTLHSPAAPLYGTQSYYRHLLKP